MVSPPWVLGVVGNSRATNMLGKGSTMIVQDSDVYAKSWGALSTDSGSNPYLYAINSNITMDTTSKDASGYVHMQSVMPRNIFLDQPLMYRPI